MTYQIKKFIASILTHPTIGWILKKSQSKIRYFDGVSIDSRQQLLSHKAIAMIFWKIYERGEARLIRKYLKDTYPVIEFGASIGIVSSLIASKIGDQLLISVEPNEDFIPIIEKNLQDNKAKNYQVINAALSYAQTPVFFLKNDSNLAGTISTENTEKAKEVKTVTIQKILNANSIKEFGLVADIEGTEIEFILYDKEALKQCQLLILETHVTRHKNIQYDHEKIKKLILNQGFKLLQSDGVCMAFGK